MMKAKQNTQGQHGGKRPGAGRPHGATNKVNRDLARLAQSYTQEALQTLYALMRDETVSANTRLAAANAILDRGHGKPKMAVEAVAALIESKPTIDATKLSDSALKELLAARRN